MYSEMMQLLANGLYYIKRLNTLASNAMVVNTTCMQAVGLAEPLCTDAYRLEIISATTHRLALMSASINSSVLIKPALIVNGVLKDVSFQRIYHSSV